MTGTRDELYTIIIISVLYHALQGADTCATSLQDAEHAGDQDLAQFFREVQGTYRQLDDPEQAGPAAATPLGARPSRASRLTGAGSPVSSRSIIRISLPVQTHRLGERRRP